MPPCLDIYVVSGRRNRRSIERFIVDWVDVERSQDRGNEELMIVPLGAVGHPTAVDQWDWEPAVSLSHIVDRGLDQPPRAFAVCLKPSDLSIYSVVLAFTVDDRVVFGVSLDDEGTSEKALERAKDILQALAREYEAEVGYIACEQPPPLALADAPPQNGIVLFEWSA